MCSSVSRHFASVFATSTSVGAGRSNPSAPIPRTSSTSCVGTPNVRSSLRVTLLFVVMEGSILQLEIIQDAIGSFDDFGVLILTLNRCHQLTPRVFDLSSDHIFR